jgi:hypothetical protein
MALILAMLAALAVGGAAIAIAGPSTHSETVTTTSSTAADSQPENSTATDEDNVQQGDQTAPDATGETEQSSEPAEPVGSDGDSAKQAAACKAAGIDPAAANVEYDDQTGKCSLDTSADAGD